jgi:FkbM family methyltransferase
MNLRSLVKAVLPSVVPRSAYNYVHGSVIVRDILAGRKLEPGIELLKDFVKEGDTVIDIGANQGRYTYHFSRTVGPSGRVYAFEPIPYNFNILSRVAAKAPYKNIVLRNEGCSDEYKELSFTVPLKHGAPFAGWSHISVDGKDEGERVKAVVRPIDETIPETDHIEFIKCDIEGAEMFAFRGALRTIKRCRPVIFSEVSARWLQRYDLTPEHVFTFFRDLGYSAHPKGEEDYLFLP